MSVSSLDYFREIVTTDRRTAELAEFDGRVIGTFCNFVPEELVLALDAVPVRLCSSDPATVAAGETFLPRDLCSVVKATGGSVHGGQGLYGRADLLVMPTPCDGKKKLGSLLAEQTQVHILDLPPRKESAGAREFWQAQLRDLQAKLEELTGNRLQRDDLRAAIQLLNRRTEAFRRFHELRRRAPAVVTGQEALFVTQASFVDDVERYTAQLGQLCDELEQAESAGEPGPRLLLTGAPLIWPNHRVIELLETNGAVVVADELCSGTQRLYQPTSLRDWSLRSMLEAIAERVLLPCTCPCFAEGHDRLDRILELVGSHAADGVVYHSLRLCALFAMESVSISATLKERGIPMLELSTDLTGEDTGQLRNRVDAFLELLAMRGPQVSR